MSFLSATKNALAEGEAALVGEIRRAASEPRHWTAAAWLLERRNPKAWGRRDRVAPSAGTRVEATPADPETSIALARFVLAGHGAEPS